MQNEISEVVLKEGFFGKIYAGGESNERQVFVNGKRQRYRAYSAISDNVSSFLIFAPTTSEKVVAMFAELELMNPKVTALENTIGQGRNRNQYYEYAVIVDGIKVKGDN